MLVCSLGNVWGCGAAGWTSWRKHSHAVHSDQTTKLDVLFSSFDSRLFFQISTWYKQYCCSFLLPGALLEQLWLCCSYLHSWLFWGDVAQREGLPCMALRHHHRITTSSHSLMEKWIYAMTDPTFVWKKSKRLEVISAQYPAFSTPADWCKASWETMYCCPMLFGGCNGKGVLLDVTFWSRIDRCNGNGKNWR